MKLFPCSDIHLDVMPLKGRSLAHVPLPQKDAIDALVIAGDLGRVKQGSFRSAIRSLCRAYNNVVFVCGNHEFYGSRPGTALRLLRMIADSTGNFSWLNNSTATIDGVTFAGSTLWFETAATLPLITDFSAIRTEPGWFARASRQSLRFLGQAAATSAVIVTHHCPVPRFTRELEPVAGFDIADFYCSPSALKILKSCSPRLWVHGHIHRHHDDRIGTTRVVCNPFGYPGEETGYDGDLVITV